MWKPLGDEHPCSNKDISSLSHAPCWFSLLIGQQPWNMEPYLTYDVISVRYKDKGTSLMPSQWRFRPPSAFLTTTIQPSNTVFIMDDLGQINVLAGILNLRKRFRMSKILFEHGINSFPLFASADTGIYPHLASQYHAWPSAARGIAMLRVDKFPYPRQQTRGY